MEAERHQKHIAVTFGNLLEKLEVGTLLDADLTPTVLSEALKKRVSWIKTADLVTPGVTTEKMVLHHLLWLQHIGRIVIDDIDPYCGAIRVRISIDDIQKRQNSSPEYGKC